jgi:hypothetical protein
MSSVFRNNIDIESLIEQQGGAREGQSFIYTGGDEDLEAIIKSTYPDEIKSGAMKFIDEAIQKMHIPPRVFKQWSKDFETEEYMEGMEDAFKWVDQS